MNALIAAAILAPPPSFEPLAKQLVADRVVPGVAIAVQRNGKMVYGRGFGAQNLETNTGMTLDSVHEMASVSKQFTATAILQLVAAGKLKLTDSICDLLPTAPESWRPVTIHHLLSHTGGLADYIGSGNLALTTSEQAQIVALKDKPVRFAPGAKFEYSNTGYMLLGAIVANVTKRPFGDVLKSDVFAKAGMTKATIANPEAIIPNRAMGYQWSGSQWRNEQYVHAKWSAFGDGMVMASARDLLRWHNALRTDAVLPANMRKLAWTSHSDGSYGYGWAINRPGLQGRVFHTGGWVGTTTIVVSDFERNDCAVILINTDRRDQKIGQLHEAVIRWMDAQ
ncbi:MAG: beta-lactamase family protein [Chthonomonas sp.]|nr:beta-lactamase family protein [Chthonomonas sp.]